MEEHHWVNATAVSEERAHHWICLRIIEWAAFQLQLNSPESNGRPSGNLTLDMQWIFAGIYIAEFLGVLLAAIPTKIASERGILTRETSSLNPWTQCITKAPYPPHGRGPSRTEDLGSWERKVLMNLVPARAVRYPALYAAYPGWITTK
ncbi:hypothetical protein B0H13DRAFT_1868087 [Mycena leptocephala]|nr:hypothetical protein B0H13DRAFT_1868087 [Mycena leptocephala]